MEVKDIKEIIELVGNMKIAHFELEKENIRMIIKTEKDTNREVDSNQSNNDRGPIPADIPISTQEKAQKVQKVSDDLVYIKSPMVGTYYASPSPDSEPFVKIGGNVKSGDVVCIIEAMKVMNEIVSDCSGEVFEVFVKSGDVVEYGQNIMSIKKQRGVTDV